MVARMTVNNLPNLAPRALIGSGRGGGVMCGAALRLKLLWCGVLRVQWDWGSS